MRIFLYGPPGSGKTTTGQCLAQQLGLPFYDLDQEIEAFTQQSIPEIFSQFGEPGFRKIEATQLQRFFLKDGFVLALGGGSLLAESNRAAALKAGQVVCLSVDRVMLAQRLSLQADTRPLLKSDLPGELERLLQARSAHYASFPLQVDTSRSTPLEAAWKTMQLIGRFKMNSMGRGCDVYAGSGHLSHCGSFLKLAGLQGPVLVISDDQVAPLYAPLVLKSLRDGGFIASSFQIPSGEASKTIDTLSRIWAEMLAARLDRKSTILALGGGVVTDLVGFAAATFLRGIPWVAIPTTLLGMVDASLGGKTGIDLAQGKNLVGAFHPPCLVLADPDVLRSLPDIEWRNGWAEVVKCAVLASPALFETLSTGPLESHGLEAMIREAMAIKIRVVEEDPFESSQRVTLNLGHTIGHAIEHASSFSIRHGEAVALGLVAEARIGEALGLTQAGTADAIERVLACLGLPVRPPPDLNQSAIRLALGVDKKRRSGKVILPLPEKIGQVRYDIEIAEEELWSLFLSCTAQT